MILRPRARGERLERLPFVEQDPRRALRPSGVSVPVDDRPLAEHGGVGLELLPQVPAQLHVVPEVRLGLDPADPLAVEHDGVVQEGVRGLRELPPKVLLGPVGDPVLLEPGREPCLALDPTDPLELPALRRVDPVLLQHLHDLPAQAGVRDLLGTTERVPEGAARGLARLLDHLGHEHGGESPLPSELEVAASPVPLLEETGSLLLHDIEALGRVAGDPVGVDHHQKVGVEPALLGHAVDVGMVLELTGELVVLLAGELGHGWKKSGRGGPMGPGLNVARGRRGPTMRGISPASRGRACAVRAWGSEGDAACGDGRRRGPRCAAPRRARS